VRKYFITGLLVWVPLAITLWVLNLVVGTMDRSVLLLPVSLQPKTLFGYDIPGLGAVLTLLVVTLTGLLVANFVGRRLLLAWESVLARIPVVKSIYSSVKQVSDTLLSGSGQAFRTALLVRFPHERAWTVGFLTGTPGPVLAQGLEGEHLSVFIPTTPNLTSGFLILVPRSDVIELAMPVDEALKYVISLGVASSALPRS
jgi:uncharacterized membrane protein